MGIVRILLLADTRFRLDTSAVLARPQLLYSYQLMRRAFSERFSQASFLLLVAFLTPSTASATQDLLIETGKGQVRVQANRNDRQAYYRLSTLAAATGCRVQTQGQTAVVTGPAGTLYLTDGRALVRFNAEYVLLSSAPWKTQGGDWYVAEDFVARALTLVLKEPLRLAGPRHYRIGSISTDVHLELINRPDQVRLIIRSRQYVPISLMEYSDRIEVALGSGRADIQFPPVQPNPEIVTSISQGEDFLIIRKGPQYDRFEESQPMTGAGFIIDLFGAPSAIVKLPPRSLPRSSPSPSRPSREGEPAERVNPTGYDQLQDWRWGPVDRRRSFVAIDPGHGGEDLGVTTGDLMEKDIALEVAFRIQSMLERAGHTCQLTRTRDVSLPVEQRSGVANYYQPRVFASIHLGGSPSASTQSSTVYVHDLSNQNPPGKGTQTTRENPGEKLVPWREAQRSYSTQSNRLGRVIQQKLGALSSHPTVVVEAPLAVLAAVGAPAVLVEIGYLTNPSQREELQSEDHRELIAEAIAEGILTFLRDSAGISNTE